MSRVTFVRCLALAILIACTLLSNAARTDSSRLAVGDVIGVVVDGEKEFTKSYQVNKDGFILMPMVDPVKVLGMSTSDSAAVITTALTKVLVNPQVTVTYMERVRMQVSVVGQVTKRGLVDVGVGDRVMHALALAGYDDTADLSHVNIRRGDEIIDLDLTKYLSGEDLAMNRELQSGDTVVVPRIDMIGTVMILGQVNKVGSVPLKRNMTFREIMGLAGGVTVEADTDNITIKRESQTDPLRVDYKRAMDGDPTADLKLLPGDSVYVPEIETAFFTVIGGVNKPGQYPLKGRLTLSEAIGMAGGAMPDRGDLRYVQVMPSSSSPDKPVETVTIDVTKVIAGTAADPLVNRGDVISVKERKPGPSVLQVLQSILPFGWIFRR